ncbi:unnamed protein product [Spirodela intermedia]|uniref:Uncharacterized protein n=1 Tax=Spirodela intermedia TaxID=51605 RepID=A0A7I8IS80_SPIIN|nr:unnamed protein product [Spirodela intermedia]CAA6659823.1 unnamed protein product [Spirodela intermedia]
MQREREREAEQWRGKELNRKGENAKSVQRRGV